MPRRSLSTTLALAFAGTTFAVFTLVGSALYFALAKQVTQQDDLDIVLAARHTRRLAQELKSLDDVRAHEDRLVSQVLGNEALTMMVLGPEHVRVFEHNNDDHVIVPEQRPRLFAHRAMAAARITGNEVVEWHVAPDTRVRGLAVDAQLLDGSKIAIVIARNMNDRWYLLDYYRDRLYAFGLGGVLLAFLISWLLVRKSLEPLREIAGHASRITVDRLDTRIEVTHTPSELHALMTSLNAMLTRLDDGFQRLSQYTADLAHDMRTPVGNMRGATEVALSRARSQDEYEAVLESNLEECDRISRMIENVLFIARAEHPQFVTTLHEINAFDELARIADYFEGVADDNHVTIRVTGDRTATLRADGELFRRAVNNLLANALRYTPAGGEITLDARSMPAMHRHPEAVRITVANPGNPIDPALLNRIFDRFYRVDPARSNAGASTGSAGLGLAIVRTIMELHRGSACAESDDVSTRFILTFAKTPALH